MHADDIVLVAHARNFSEIEYILNNPNKIQKYFQKWHLKINLNKSITKTFHLNNWEAKRKLVIKIAGNNEILQECFKYLGVKFDKLLTYNQHLIS